MLYSQPSFRIRWLLDQQPKGTAWSDRDSERENDDNAWRAARRQVTGQLTGLGVQPRWLTPDTLAGGALRDPGLRVLMLPHAIALSDAELAEIRAFAARGGKVLADTEPGVFDGHGRRRAALPLAGIAAMPQAVRPDGDGAGPGALAQVLAEAGVELPFRVLGPDGQPADGVDVRVWDNGGVVLLALQASRPWGAPPRVTVPLPAGLLVRNMRTAQPDGWSTAPDKGAGLGLLNVNLDGVEPVMLVFSPSVLPGPALSSEAGKVRVQLDGPTPAAQGMAGLEWLDASGAVLGSTQVRIGGGGAAAAPMPGAASVRMRDPLTGRTATLALPSTSLSTPGRGPG